MIRLGYDSVVIEGRASHLDRRDLPFELRSLGGGETGPDAGAAAPNRGGQSGRFPGRLAHWLGQLASRVPGIRYAVDHVYWYGVRTFLAAPMASLYYLHAFTQFPAVYLRSRIHGVPYVYDAHDFYQGIEDGGEFGWLHRRLRLPWERWLEAACIRHAAAVVTVSDGVAALQGQAFGCRPTVIRNCEDRRLHRAPSRRLRETTAVEPSGFLFVVVGHAKPGQAIPQLLEAMRGTPPHVHVALLGMGYERFAARIQALDLQSRVHLLPPVRSFEVVPFIEDADASLLLYYARSRNYAQCLPNGFFQAIAAGLPLLYPELPEVARLARDHALGLPIDPLSPASIARGMLAFAEQPDRLLEFRRNAQRAREVLNWEGEEEILATLLRRCLHGPHRGEA
jgi:glycosyltransferase involved in cell wall biosynthesis